MKIPHNVELLSFGLQRSITLGLPSSGVPVGLDPREGLERGTIIGTEK